MRKENAALNTALMKRPVVLSGKEIGHQLIGCNKQLLDTYFVTVPIIHIFYLNQCFRCINGCNNFTHASDRFIFITARTVSSFSLCRICFDHYTFRRQSYILCKTHHMHILLSVQICIDQSLISGLGVHGKAS